MSIAHKIRFWQKQFDLYGFEAQVITTSEHETAKAIDFIENHKVRWGAQIADQLAARQTMYILMGPDLLTTFTILTKEQGNAVLTHGKLITDRSAPTAPLWSRWYKLQRMWRCGFIPVSTGVLKQWGRR